MISPNRNRNGRSNRYMFKNPWGANARFLDRVIGVDINRHVNAGRDLGCRNNSGRRSENVDEGIKILPR